MKLILICLMLAGCASISKVDNYYDQKLDIVKEQYDADYEAIVSEKISPEEKNQKIKQLNLKVKALVLDLEYQRSKEKDNEAAADHARYSEALKTMSDGFKSGVKKPVHCTSTRVLGSVETDCN